MPKRNLLLLCLMTVVCLAAWLARDRGLHGRRFGEVMTAIERSYLEPVDADALFGAAMEGVFSRLDENSAFLEGEGRRDLDAALDQEFGGVGLELSADGQGGIVVQTPVPGSPAWQAAIGPGDRILAIDGATTVGMKLKDAVAAFRGRPGSTVVITTLPRAADAIPRSVTLVRETIRTESVQGDRRLPDGSWEWFIEGEPSIAFIRITGFGDHTLEELERALEAIAARARPEGIILDLRGNPGGLLSAAVGVCDLFLDEGVIVSTRGRNAGSAASGGSANVRRATVGGFVDVPMAVLVDGLTASAGEIVAASLQDNGRAAIVGSRTFGKGTVQSIFPLSDGQSLVKLTTSEYLRPSNANIHRHDGAAEWGVSPDRGNEIVPTAETLGAIASWRRDRDAAYPPGTAPASPAEEERSSADLPRTIDPVLARAIDILHAAR